MKQKEIFSLFALFVLELMKADEMFDIELIEKFRCKDFDNHKDRELIKKAWYIFVFKLLPLVNEEWCKVLKDSHIQSKPNIYDYTSISDEVFTRWIIRCKYDKLLEEMHNGWPEKDADKKGKKGGPHESRVNMNLYCEEYEETQESFELLSSVRNEVKLREIQNKWNNLFWDEMVIHNADKFGERPKKKRMSVEQTYTIPGMDTAW